MDIVQNLTQLDRSVAGRYRQGTPVTLALPGVHPDVFIETLGEPYPFDYSPYLNGSPNIAGEHAVRHVVALDGITGDRAINPAVLIDGLGDHSDKVFGLVVEPSVLNGIARYLELPISFE